VAEAAVGFVAANAADALASKERRLAATRGSPRDERSVPA